MKSKILQIHGFASAGNGTKAKELKRLLPECEVVSPSLPVSPKSAFKLLERLVSSHHDKGSFVLPIGTSLGGFYAMCLSLHFKIPAVILNPSTTPGSSLERALGLNTNLKTGEEFEFTLEHLEQFNELTPNYPSVKPEDGRRIYAFIAEDDTVILPETSIPNLEPANISVTLVPTGTHRFEDLNVITPLIHKLLK